MTSINSPTLPEGFDDLLSAPLVGALATMTSSGEINLSPMWYEWDGEFLMFSHRRKSYARKLQDLEANRIFSFVIVDPVNTLRFLQLRGELDSIEVDPDAKFFFDTTARYGAVAPDSIVYRDERVIVKLRPTTFQGGPVIRGEVATAKEAE